MQEGPDNAPVGVFIDDAPVRISMLLLALEEISIGDASVGISELLLAPVGISIDDASVVDYKEQD